LAGEVRELSKAKEKIAGVKISAFNSNGDLIDSTRSDSTGRFTLDLPFDQDFKIRGEKDGFETLVDLGFSTKGKPFGVDSLTLPLWRQNLFSRGRIFSKETQSILPGVAVVLHNLTDGSSDTLIVDETGEYRFLVRPGKNYRIVATKEGFIPDGFILDTKDILEGNLLNDIVLEEVYIDKEVILFDYDKAEIKGDAIKMLSKVVRTMIKFPRATLNIGAHSDSRGSHNYNTELSKKRAQSTRDYFLARGIPASRIEVTWFGEELILNRCSDGVECPEEEHSMNRRAELKVQKEPVD
jgi:outer membrane protein OmpA-like peptidoglycan-associated protein